MIEIAGFYTFLLVFVRCGAMLLASPVFGSHNTPTQVRIFTTLAIAGSLSLIIRDQSAAVPASLGALITQMIHEAGIGILIGGVIQLALQAASMAGAIMDTQSGLSSAHVMNPIDGHSSTLLSQFKFMISVVVFLQVDGHHSMIRAFVASYQAIPTSAQQSFAWDQVQMGVLQLLQASCLLALQIAGPVLAVSLVTDAALGLVNRAVPQMPAMIVGMPAKLVAGLVAVALGLPALTNGTQAILGQAFDQLGRMIR